MSKKVVSAAISGAIVFSAFSALAENGHVHNWIDDVKNSTSETNAYYCECGAEKYEDVSLIRDYVITFDANGGFTDVKSLVTKDGKVKLPFCYRGSDYLFVGWFTDKDGGCEVTSDHVFADDTTLYAKWEIVGTRRLIFATDGGSDMKEITMPYGSALNLKDFIPTKDGCIFDGWYTDPRTKENRITVFTFNDDGVLYAKWTKESDELIIPVGTDNLSLTDEQTEYKIRMMTAQSEESAVQAKYDNLMKQRFYELLNLLLQN